MIDQEYSAEDEVIFGQAYLKIKEIEAQKKALTDKYKADKIRIRELLERVESRFYDDLASWKDSQNKLLNELIILQEKYGF